MPRKRAERPAEAPKRKRAPAVEKVESETPEAEPAPAVPEEVVDRNRESFEKAARAQWAEQGKPL